jgi:hypothetical protein
MRERSVLLCCNQPSSQILSPVVALLKISLGAAAPGPMEQQITDHRRLDGDDRERYDDVPNILLPHRRLSKDDHAAGGQAILADVPAL